MDAGDAWERLKMLLVGPTAKSGPDDLEIAALEREQAALRERGDFPGAFTTGMDLVFGHRARGKREQALACAEALCSIAAEAGSAGHLAEAMHQVGLELRDCGHLDDRSG